MNLKNFEVFRELVSSGETRISGGSSNGRNAFVPDNEKDVNLKTVKLNK